MTQQREALRLDSALAARGLAPSRQRAQALIRSGRVTVNGRTVLRCAQAVQPGDELAVSAGGPEYVGRGALKLLSALDVFGVSPEGLACVDLGASTGGFTQVLLERGAARVYAVDVGTDQLDPILRRDPRVISMEQTNARALTRGDFPGAIDLITADLSFISIRLLLPVLFDLLNGQGCALVLIKPQFEAGRAALNRKGLVTDPKAHLNVLREVREAVQAQGWAMARVIPSPVAGGSGNREYLALLTPAGGAPTDEQLRTCVRANFAQTFQMQERPSARS